MNEKQWTELVIRDILRGLFKFELVYHTHDSRHSAAGFPDIIAVRPFAGTVYAVELKTDSTRAKLSPAQREWLAAFHRYPTSQAFVWRPRHAQAIVDYLRTWRTPDGATLAEWLEWQKGQGS